MGQAAAAINFRFNAVELDSRRVAVVALSRRTQPLNAADVAALRRDIFADGVINRDEAIALFALERANFAKCAEWTQFFVEAVTDHVVWQSRPTGVVNAEQAEWLIAESDVTNSINAFAVLVNVLAEAHRLPQWFLAAVRARAARVPGVLEALEQGGCEYDQALGAP
jgi:hypothetical protein